jgi:Galactose-1-phosphate uridylyltransferase
MSVSYQKNSSGLLQDLIQKEIADKQRILYLDSEAIAFVPACARYPYEVWIAPITPAATFIDLTEKQRQSLAKALKTVALKYDGLWHRPFPYLMAWFQAPHRRKTASRSAFARSIFIRPIDRAID